MATSVASEVPGATCPELLPRELHASRRFAVLGQALHEPLHRLPVVERAGLGGSERLAEGERWPRRALPVRPPRSPGPAPPARGSPGAPGVSASAVERRRAASSTAVALPTQRRTARPVRGSMTSSVGSASAGNCSTKARFSGFSVSTSSQT